MTNWVRRSFSGFVRLDLQQLSIPRSHSIRVRTYISNGWHHIPRTIQRYAAANQRSSGVTMLTAKSRTWKHVFIRGRAKSSIFGGMTMSTLPILLFRCDAPENAPFEDETSELRILAASEKESRAVRSRYSDSSYAGRLLDSTFNFIIVWLIEPLATGMRFVHLACIFVPVILSMSAVYIGSRQPDRDNERIGTLWWYKFLVRSMERAGPAFIKLGQWAASRTDIFPSEMCSIMSTLHSNVAAHPLHKTKEIIELAFGGRSFDSIFIEFDEKPLGVGAIAQVYRAKLNNDLLSSVLKNTKGSAPKTLKGSAQDLLNKVDSFVKTSPPKIPSDWVAIKVLHPRVERLVHRDLRIMKAFATLINAIPTLEWLSLPDEVDKFGEMMRLQLDLRIEASNLVRFRENFKSRNTVAFPIPYVDYTTREVLVEEFASGIPLGSFLESGGAGPYQNSLADMGLDAFLHMLLIDNFAHADLHPGNILVRFFNPSSGANFNRLRFPFSKSSSSHSIPDIVSEDPESISRVTEAALSRLRPLTGRPDEWKAELTKLSDEGYVPQLIFIDTGLITELSPINRQNFLELFTAVAEFDGYHAGQLMVDRCRQPNAVINKDIFCLRMQHLVLGVKSKTFTLGKIKIADILSEVMSMIRSHHVRLEGDFINVVVSILLLEGIGRRLDPNIDIFKSSLPILRQLGAQRGHEMLSAKDLSMLKIWLGLELRTILSSSIQDFDDFLLVKYLWNE